MLALVACALPQQWKLQIYRRAHCGGWEENAPAERPMPVGLGFHAGGGHVRRTILTASLLGLFHDWAAGKSRVQQWLPLLKNACWWHTQALSVVVSCMLSQEVAAPCLAESPSWLPDPERQQGRGLVEHGRNGGVTGQLNVTRSVSQYVIKSGGSCLSSLRDYLEVRMFYSFVLRLPPATAGCSTCLFRAAALAQLIGNRIEAWIV